MLIHVMHKLILLAPMAWFLMVAIIQMCTAQLFPILIWYLITVETMTTAQWRLEKRCLRRGLPPVSDCSIMNSLTQPDSPPQGKFPYNYSSEAKHMLPVSVTSQRERRVFPSLYPGNCLFWGVNNLWCCLRSKLENEWISILWIKTKTPPCPCRIS